MSWMFYSIDLIGNLLDELVMISCFRSVSGSRPKSLRGIIAVCVVLALLRSAVYFTFHNTVVTLVASLITITLVSLMYSLSHQKRLVFIPFMMIMTLFSEMLVSLLITLFTNTSTDSGVSSILYYAGGVMLSKMVLFSILKLVQFIIPSIGERIPGYLMVPLLMLPVASFLMTWVLGEYTLRDGASTLTYIAIGALVMLAFANVGLFFLLEYQQRQEKEKSRMHLMQKQTEAQIVYYRELAERQKISNKTMHDLKNQMFALSEAMKTAPDKTREIMDNISGKIFAASPMTVTGIDAVDSLIFSKQQQMDARGIRYEQSVFISADNAFEPLDLCVALGNLLDNAIEANDTVEPDQRYVSLNITRQERWLSITVKNAASAAVRMEDGHSIRTTKAQKELHGFGLSSVREIAAKYQGDCTFQSTDRDFTACLLLQDV